MFLSKMDQKRVNKILITEYSEQQFIWRHKGVHHRFMSRFMTIMNPSLVQSKCQNINKLLSH